MPNPDLRHEQRLTGATMGGRCARRRVRWTQLAYLATLDALTPAAAASRLISTAAAAPNPGRR